MLGHRKLTLEDYLDILRRRLWIVAIPVLVFPIIAVGISFFITPQYLSQTLVIIDHQKVPDDIVKPVVSSDLDSRLSSMREQILSRSRIQPIIERYNLYGNKHMSLDDRIDLVRKGIAIRPIHSDISRAGGLPGFYISFTANDARTAQLVCGEVTRLFLDANLKNREDTTQGTTEFIKNQLAAAKTNLDEQDAKLAAFQRENIGKLPGEGTPNVNMLTSLNTQLEAATQQLGRMEQDKSYLESMLSQQIAAAATSASGGAGQSVAPQVQQAELQTLLSQEADLTSHYTNDYPDVIAIRRKIADLRRKIAEPPPAVSTTAANSAPTRYDSPAIQQLRAQLRAAEQGIQSKRAEQAQIQSSVRIYQDRIASSPLAEEQYKALTRDYTTAQGFYDELLKKMNQSKMATALESQMQGEQFRIMDEPNLPDSPSFPKRPVFAGAGLAAGLMLGLAIIGLLEYQNTALRNERDIWAFTRLPTLAVIAYSGEIRAESTEIIKNERIKRKSKKKKDDDIALSEAKAGNV
jgi:polysaccharide chain length determinant protein (PEP-CTERM system associated)